MFMRVPASKCKLLYNSPNKKKNAFATVRTQYIYFVLVEEKNEQKFTEFYSDELVFYVEPMY